MEGIEEEEGSDNETMGKETAKKGKRVLSKHSMSLSQMEKEMGIRFIELEVSRLFE